MEKIATQNHIYKEISGWQWVEKDLGGFLQAECLLDASFQHAFFTKKWHGKKPNELSSTLDNQASIHYLDQIHSLEIIAASKSNTDPKRKGDGLISDKKNQSLWVYTADCMPVFIADPISGHVAAIHAGWKGLINGILIKGLKRFIKNGSRKNNLLIVLGPCISKENYSFDKIHAESLATKLHPKISNKNNPKSITKYDLYDSKVFSKDQDKSKVKLDLRMAGQYQLTRLGLEESQITICPLCTFKENEIFHSWRREQVKSSQWNVIYTQSKY